MRTFQGRRGLPEPGAKPSRSLGRAGTGRWGRGRGRKLTPKMFPPSPQTTTSPIVESALWRWSKFHPAFLMNEKLKPAAREARKKGSERGKTGPGSHYQTSNGYWGRPGSLPQGPLLFWLASALPFLPTCSLFLWQQHPRCPAHLPVPFVPFAL